MLVTTLKPVKADFMLFGTLFLKYSNSRMREVGAFEIASLRHYKHNIFEFKNVYMQVKQHYISVARGKLFTLNVAPPIVTECTININCGV